jgi:hypothetical protein
MLKKATLVIALVGVLMLVIGIVNDDKAVAAVGLLLGICFGVLRALLSVSRLF